MQKNNGEINGVNGKGRRTVSNLCVCDQEKHKDELPGDMSREF